MINKNNIGLKELRSNMETYIKRVNKGETITVLRRNTPLFKLTPVINDESEWETVIDFVKETGDGISTNELIQTLNTYGQNPKAAR